MTSPMISVVMPVYNGEKYLREAINSILNQTYTDFEFIILNDGSTDNTEEIIFSYNDPRIVYVKNEENLQIVKTLNKGIGLAKGKYIARMDADDISLPERLEKQIDFMESNPNIDLCGSYVQNFGERKDILYRPKSHNEIIVEFLFNSAIAHPTVFAKRTFYKDMKYEEKYNKAEDYALWVKASKKYVFANIPEVLLHYRRHTAQTNDGEQIEKANLVRKMMLMYMGDCFDDGDEIILNSIATYQYVKLSKIENIYNKIIKQNNDLKVFDAEYLNKLFVERVWWMLHANTDKGISLYIDYWKSPLRKLSAISFAEEVKFFIKCLIGYRHAK